MKKKSKIITRDNVYELYRECLSVDYINVGLNVNYAISREGNTLKIFFEWSDGVVDWINNFRFRAKPYSDMKPGWKCHAGFLFCWEQVKELIGKEIRDLTITDIIIVGYSHGAALATLCHEYCVFNRPDIFDNIRGYGFGCPRVYGRWTMPKILKRRWKNFTPIRKDNDIVTHLPPKLFGYRHVNKVLVIGSRKDDGPIDSHRQDRYLRELRKYEQEKWRLKRLKDILRLGSKLYFYFMDNMKFLNLMYRDYNEEDLKRIFHRDEWEIVEVRSFKVKVRKKSYFDCEEVWISKRKLKQLLKHNCTEDDLYSLLERRYRLK